MDKFVEKMKADGLNDAAIAAFKHNYEQLVAGNDGIVAESDIEAVAVRYPPRERNSMLLKFSLRSLDLHWSTAIVSAEFAVNE
jgi:hypothetical protein